MKIAIDTHFISSEPSTGNYTYSSELIQAMVNFNSPHEFILYAIDKNPFYRRFDDNDRVKIRYVLSPNGIVRNFISIPKALAEDKPDIANLHFIKPFFVSVPIILNVHDLYYTHGQDLTTYQRTIGKLTMWSIPRADKVITISEFSRLDILRASGINPSKISAFPLGVGKQFTPTVECGDIRRRIGIQNEYLLSVCRTEDPRKNIMTLIEAYAVMKAEHLFSGQLVIAGRHGPGSEKYIQRVYELGLENDILFSGVIDHADLPALITGAKVFIYVSSFEGFGLPVLEAMACGTPVITSDVSSLPEVAGEAAIMVPPGDTNALAKAMKQVVSNVSLQESMRLRGFKQAKRFNWENVAASTIKAYEELLGSNR